MTWEFAAGGTFYWQYAFCNLWVSLFLSSTYIYIYIRVLCGNADLRVFAETWSGGRLYSARFYSPRHVITSVASFHLLLFLFLLLVHFAIAAIDRTGSSGDVSHGASCRVNENASESSRELRYNTLFRLSATRVGVGSYSGGLSHLSIDQGRARGLSLSETSRRAKSRVIIIITISSPARDVRMPLGIGGAALSYTFRAIVRYEWLTFHVDDCKESRTMLLHYVK